MRQFAGFSTPEETNARFQYLLAQGQTGLSVAYDLPTLMGYDADSLLSEGEVGKCGVAVSSLADMEVLFDEIPLEQVTVSQTINAPASVLLAMYLVVAEKQGADWKKISGTLQNDILKEYIAQKEWIYPIQPAMKLVIDTFEFCTQHVPRYNPISVSGYHIREAGATAIQELAFTLRDGLEYVEWGLKAGLDLDQFRAAHLFLLQRAQRFLRRGCQVSRGASHLGAGDARSFRFDKRAHAEASFPHANCRRFADRSAAAEQHRARCDSGAGRSSRRHAESAH